MCVCAKCTFFINIGYLISGTPLLLLLAKAPSSLLDEGERGSMNLSMAQQD